MRKWIVIVVVCLSVAGCVPTEEQVLDLGNDVDLLMVKIDEQQEKLTGEIDKVQDRVILVNDAMKAAETLPEKAAAGIEASRPFNPYADEMAAILGLTTVVGGLWGRNKAKKYKAHRQGVERIMVGMDGDTREALYDSIGKARAANGV